MGRVSVRYTSGSNISGSSITCSGVLKYDAFGLDSDAARAARLLFQPVLVAWALWATGARRAACRWKRR